MQWKSFLYSLNRPFYSIGFLRLSLIQRQVQKILMVLSMGEDSPISSFRMMSQREFEGSTPEKVRILAIAVLWSRCPCTTHQYHLKPAASLTDSHVTKGKYASELRRYYALFNQLLNSIVYFLICVRWSNIKRKVVQLRLKKPLKNQQAHLKFRARQDQILCWNDLLPQERLS